jgi:hypothetical protein
MARDIKIVKSSEIGIKGEKDKEHVHVDLDRIPTIATYPVAVHLKEVNHIDPISVDALHVSEVKNIDPIRVDKFHVSHLPTVNLSLRQLPSVNMNVRRVPPLSVGTYQNFMVPSDYTIRAQVLGVEFLRVHVGGRTCLMPTERYRREQSQAHHRSFPEVAASGNPAIPSRQKEKSTTIQQPFHRPQPPPHLGRTPGLRGPVIGRATQRASGPVGAGAASTSSLKPGLPRTGFPLPRSAPVGHRTGSSVSSGG